MFNNVDQEKLFNEYISKGVLVEVRKISKLWDRIQKSDKIEAHGLYAKQKMMREGGTSTRAASNSSYPTAHSSTPGETITRLKRAQMFTLHFDGFSMELAQKNGAEMDPIEFEKKGLFINMANDLSRQLMGDGSGVMAFVNGAVTASATVVIDHPLYADLRRFFKKGMILDIYNGSTKQADSVVVQSVDSATQITLTAAVTVADDAKIYREDVYTGTEGAGLGEMMGLDGIIRATDPPAPNASAGLQGVLVATDPEWKCYTNTNSGTARDLTEVLLTTCFDELEMPELITALLTTPGVRRFWASKLITYKSLPNQKTLWGGWDGLPFIYDGREIPLVSDKFIPDKRLYGLSESELKIFVTQTGQPITWEKGDAGGILQKVAGKNEYQAEGHIFGNMGVPIRKDAGFMMNDLNVA